MKLKLAILSMLFLSVVLLAGCNLNPTTAATTKDNKTTATVAPTTVAPTTTAAGVDELSSIAAEAKANKKFYNGDTLDKADLTVTGKYVNSVSGAEKSEAITEYTIAIKNQEGLVLKTGENTVVVTCGEKTCEVTITALAAVFETVEEAIERAEQIDYTVASGKVNKNELNNFFSADTDYSYELGVNIYKEETIYDGVVSQTVYDSLSNGNIYSIVVYPDGTTQSNTYGLTADAVKGFGIDFFGTGNAQANGCAGIMRFIYGYSEFVSEEAFSTAVIEGENKEKAYTVSFGTVENGYYYSLEATMTLFENGAIKTLTVVQKMYLDDIGEQLYTTTTYSFTQELGERVTSFGYEADKLTISEYDVKIGDTVIADGAELSYDLDDGDKYDEGNRLNLVLTYTCDSTLLNTDPIEVTFVGTLFDGTEVSSEGWSLDCNCYQDWETGAQNVQFRTPGTYTITLTSVNITKTITFVIAPETPSTIGADVYENLGENSAFNKAESYQMYTANEIYIKADILDKYDQNYTLSLVEAEGAAIEKTTVLGKDCYKFTATAVGTYHVVVTAKENAEVTATLTIEVLAAPEISELLNGVYYAKVAGVDYTITFDYEAKTVTITDGTKTQSFAFSYENGTLVANQPTGDDLGLDIVMNTKYQLLLANADDNTFILKREKDTDTNELSGEYKLSLMGGMVTFTFTFAEVEGVKTLTVNDGSKTGTYTYEIGTDGVLACKLVDGKDRMGDNFLHIVDGKLCYNFGETDYECTKMGAPVEDPTEDDEIPATFVGTWKDTTGYTIVITATSVQMDGDTYTNWSLDRGALVVDMGWDKVTFTLVDEKTMSDGNYTFTKDGGSETDPTESDTIPEAFIGTWADSTGYEIVITSTTVTVGGESCKSWSLDRGALVVDMGGEKITLTMINATIIDDGMYSYSKQEGGSETDPTESDTIPTSYIGTWKDSEGYAIVITSTTVDYCGTTADSWSLDRGALVIACGSDKFTLTIKNDTTLDDGLYTYTKQEEQPTVTIDSFIGTWADTTGWTIVITSTNVNNGGTDCVSMDLKDGKLVVDMGGETITFTLKDANTLDDGMYTYTKKEEQPTVTIDSFIGTWADTTGWTIVITSTNVNNGGTDCVSMDLKDGKLVVDMGGEVITFTLKDANTLDDGMYTYTKKEVSEGGAKVPAEFCGTYYDTYGEAKYIVSETSVTIGYATCNVTKVDGSSITVSFYGSDYTLTISDGVLTDGDEKYPSTAPSFGNERTTIADAFVGVWAVDYLEITITSTTVTDTSDDWNGGKVNEAFTIVKIYDNKIEATSAYGDTVIFVLGSDGKLYMSSSYYPLTKNAA